MERAPRRQRARRRGAVVRDLSKRRTADPWRRRDRAEVLRGAAAAPRTRRPRRCPHRTIALAGPCCASASRAAFATRTRDEWVHVFEGSDACVAPVLTFSEAAVHPHNAARAGHVECRRHCAAGTRAAVVANAGRRPRAAARARRRNGRAALRDWGFSDVKIERFARRALGLAAVTKARGRRICVSSKNLIE